MKEAACFQVASFLIATVQGRLYPTGFDYYSRPMRRTFVGIGRTGSAGQPGLRGLYILFFSPIFGAKNDKAIVTD